MKVLLHDCSCNRSFLCCCRFANLQAHDIPLSTSGELRAKAQKFLTKRGGFFFFLPPSRRGGEGGFAFLNVSRPARINGTNPPFQNFRIIDLEKS